MKNKYSTQKNGNSTISKANKTNPGTMGVKSICKEAFLNDRRGHSMKVKTTTKHTRITNNMEEKNVDVLMAPKYQHSGIFELHLNKMNGRVPLTMCLILFGQLLKFYLRVLPKEKAVPQVSNKIAQ